MTENNKESIANLRCEGKSYGEIASILGLTKNMVGFYCRRLGIGGEIEEIGTVRRCKNCEKLFVSERGHKQ